MRSLFALLLSSAALLTVLPASAQTADSAPAGTEAPAPTSEPETAPEAAEAPIAPQATSPTPPQQQIPTSREDAQVGQTYIAGQFTDWVLRCIRIEQPNDICELHQPLSDSDGTRTAEINIFPLNQGQAIAGGTIVTPLETLLTENVRMSVDGGEVRAYPYSFCNRVGCVSQIGLTQADLDSFRRGASARVAVVPLAAPDKVVSLSISLSGFTAGYQAMVDSMKSTDGGQ